MEEWITCCIGITAGSGSPQAVKLRMLGVYSGAVSMVFLLLCSSLNLAFACCCYQLSPLELR